MPFLTRWGRGELFAATNISYEERKIIEEMRAESAPYQKIALTLNKSASCIHREVHRYGVDGTYNADIAQKLYEERKTKTKPLRGRRLSQATKNEICNQLKMKVPTFVISKNLGVSTETIARYKKLFLFLQSSNDVENLDKNVEDILQRVSALEMQVKILTDQIKEILCRK